VGKTISPVSGQEVKKQSIEDIVNCMIAYPQETRYTVLSPIPPLPEGKEERKRLEIYLKMGFSRIDVDGEVMRIEDLISDDAYLGKTIEGCFIVIDRLSVDYGKDSISRLTDSAETAMYEGNGSCMLCFYLPEGTVKHTFSNKFEADGITFEEPTDQMFSFNSPVGACPDCEG
ncbi:UvrABC system protein A, partial [termite gut metagenome]